MESEEKTERRVKVDAFEEYEALQHEMRVLDSMVSGLQAFAEGGFNEQQAYSYRYQFSRVEKALAEFKAKVPIYKGEYDE